MVRRMPYTGDSVLTDKFIVYCHHVGRLSITTVMVKMELINESRIGVTGMSKLSRESP